MNFEKFLIENNNKSDYKKSLTIEEAVNIIKEKCRDTMKTPLWRGMNSSGDAFEMDGSKRKRSSATVKEHGNYYNVIFDYQLKKENLPLRSSCVIATGHNRQGHTEHFGNSLYAIFPYDGTTIAQSKSDIWNIRVDLYDKITDMYEMNDLLFRAKIDFTSFDSIVNSLYEKQLPEFSEYNYSKRKIEQWILEQYNINRLFNFTNTNKINHDSVEVWFDGKCIGIEESIYNEVKALLDAS